MPLTIREYCETDFLLLRSAFASAREMEVWCGNRYQYPLTQDQISRRMVDESVHLYSALLDDQVVGHAEVADGTDDSSLPIGIVRCVFIAASRRGCGSGKHMLQQIMDTSRHDRFRLAVYKENLPAVRLYQSLGFTQVQEIVVDGQPLLVMDC